jgi:hypothetical protein
MSPLDDARAHLAQGGHASTLPGVGVDGLGGVI